MINLPVKRKKTRVIKVGQVPVGGGSPISVQTMTNTRTEDKKATVEQATLLWNSGADIIRVSINTEKALQTIPLLKKEIGAGIVADIHFNWKLAIESLEAGADKIRINPGTIGSEKHLFEVIRAAKELDKPIRLGMNAASLPRKFLGTGRVEGLLQATEYWVRLFEDFGFYNIVISTKTSSPLETIEVYRKISKKYRYPIHLGVTEAGTLLAGTVRSVAAMAPLLLDGIGDTIRISLSADPKFEVISARHLLIALGLKKGPVLISCPTCSRAELDVVSLATSVEEKIQKIKEPLVIAVMGCAVNGPGEAKEADVGIAGSGKGIMLFKKGKPLRVVSSENALEELMKEVEFIVKTEEAKNETI